MQMPKISSVPVFRADKNNVNPSTGEYVDPLMKMPLRGAAFSNEVGEGLRPLIGEYATLSWIPALLYIGADIYDKYKNNQTEYSPSSRRGFQQAVFQGMASIALPLVAVKAGQNLFSMIGLASKDKITINMQEKISELAQRYVTNGKMHKYRNKQDECIKDFVDTVLNNTDSQLKKTFEFNKKADVKKYAENTIKNLISMYKSFMMPTEKFKETNWYKNFKQAMQNGQTDNVAAKTILAKYQDSKTIKGRVIRTLGGFVALSIAINPIDKFVEDVLIEKLMNHKKDA